MERLVDDELEKAIDEVGRDKVFQRAKEVGWRYGEDPPKWVWWGIIAELRAVSVTNGVRG
jgi:hypothetical protein